MIMTVTVTVTMMMSLAVTERIWWPVDMETDRDVYKENMCEGLMMMMMMMMMHVRGTDDDDDDAQAAKSAMQRTEKENTGRHKIK